MCTWGLGTPSGVFLTRLTCVRLPLPGAALGPLLAGLLSPSGWNNVFYMLMFADACALLVSLSGCRPPAGDASPGSCGPPGGLACARDARPASVVGAHVLPCSFGRDGREAESRGTLAWDPSPVVHRLL